MEAIKRCSLDTSIMLIAARIFLFKFVVTGRALHSFPTRRSSDLRCAQPSATLAAFAYKSRAATPRNCRSEEHTSELQSHSDLVCRLLLEKKKTHQKYLKVLTSSSWKRYNSAGWIR